MTGPEATGAARYNPGRWIAIASPVSWLLADLDPHSPVVARCYELIVSGAPPEDVLDAFLSLGLRSVPSFGFVSAPRGTLLLRGSARASVLSSDGTSTDYDSTAATTWAEHRLLSAPAAFRLIGSADGGSAPSRDAAVELPLTDGVTMASSITVHTQSAAGLAALRSAAPIGDYVPQPIPGGPGGPGGTGGPGGPGGPTASAPGTGFSSTPHSSPPHPGQAAAARSEASSGPVAPPPGTGSIPAGADAGGPIIDSLPWVERPRPAAPPAPVPPAAGPGGPASPGPFTPPPPPAPYQDAPAPTNPVPAASPAASAPAPGAAPDPAQPEGESEATMGRSLLRALIAAQDPEVAAGPTVHAVHCQQGHLNPAHASACRVCGSFVLDEAPVTVPRPVLGSLRLSTGDIVPLDRGVLLGRNPKGADTGPDSDRHVVRVPSPTGDISRAHTEVLLDGWHVLVVDLNSTNGTVVILPGRAPERLRPSEPRPIEPGTLVMLSDEVSFRFEVDQ